MCNDLYITGDLIPETAKLNYRELCVLSPIKLMSQVTRKSTLYNGRIGHYEVSGAMYRTLNYEFPEMLYGETLSLFFQRGDPAMINKKKVRDAFDKLQITHPLLSRFKLPKLTYSLVNYHISENKKHIGIKTNDWQNNALFAQEDTNPQATDVEFNDLIIGRDTNGKSVKYSHPGLMALLFPHIFTHCKGHISLVSIHTDEAKNREGVYGLPESHGGVAAATFTETLGAFAKSRLLCADRRFSVDPSFLFYLLDSVEKKNISSANHFVACSKGRGTLKKKDIFNSATKKLNRNIVSIVPPTIRSSYAYKRKNFLNLQTIFQRLGAPQLFITITCNDTSDDFKGLNKDVKKPWEDPVIFAMHWKRKWQYFFHKTILKHFAQQIGGIKEFSWVLEVQDRGSPHIHMVL